MEEQRLSRFTLFRLGIAKSLRFLLITLFAAVLSTVFVYESQVSAEKKQLVELEAQLTTVLNSTFAATNNYLQRLERETAMWANHHDIVDLVKNKSHEKKYLLNERLNYQLSQQLRQPGYLDYIVFDNQKKVISSSNDTLLGRKLVDELERDLVTRSMQPPSYRAIKLPQHSNDQKLGLDASENLWVGSAIVGPANEIVGTLIFKIDPQVEFTDILQLGRIGSSGESYAFNKEGDLISESRFDKALVEIGLIKAGQRGILNIEIRDPGVDLTTGAKSVIDRELQPLTIMAERATQGFDGANLQGYNDYRGVPVVGAWRWSDQYQFGVLGIFPSKKT